MIVTHEDRMICRLYPDSITAAGVKMRLTRLHFGREFSKSLPKFIKEDNLQKVLSYVRRNNR